MISHNTLPLKIGVLAFITVNDSIDCLRDRLDGTAHVSRRKTPPVPRRFNVFPIMEHDDITEVARYLNHWNPEYCKRM